MIEKIYFYRKPGTADFIQSEKEKKIIVLRYYIGKTQMEIAEELDISQAQVSRMEKNALRKIKEKVKE